MAVLTDLRTTDGFLGSDRTGKYAKVAPWVNTGGRIYTVMSKKIRE